MTAPDLNHESKQENEKIIKIIKSDQNGKDLIAFLQENQIEWTRSLQYQKNQISMGKLALELGLENVYEALVQYGAQTEFVLSLLGQRIVEDGDTILVENETIVSNAGYLSRKLEFTKDQQGGERLVDSDMNGVMMGWEDPLMLLHADLVTKDRAPGLRVLNVGFGLGLIDTYLQNSHPSSHTIIEAHPDVYKKMINDGWDKKATIIFGRWQDVKDQLQVYDAIFFDTFGEYMDDLKEFHELLPNILREDGIYSFFNGLAATDTFLHDVACRICELDLCDIGFQVEWTKIEMDKLGDAVWKGIKREYFSLPIYNLPKVTFNF